MNSIFVKRRKRKNLQGLRRTVTQFEATSIGDMAFLLLIFFIVTGSFMVRQGLFLSLPSKNASSVHVSEERIFEIIPQESSYKCNEELLNASQLEDRLKQKKTQTDDIVVIIKMFKNVRYERMIDTLSIVKEIGVKKISVKMIEEI